MNENETDAFLPFELEAFKQGLELSGEALSGIIKTAPDGFHRILASNDEPGIYVFIKSEGELYTDDEHYDSTETIGCIFNDLMESGRSVITLRSLSLEVFEELGTVNPTVFNDDLVPCMLRSWVVEWGGVKALSDSNLQEIHEAFIRRTGYDLATNVQFLTAWDIKT